MDTLADEVAYKVCSKKYVVGDCRRFSFDIKRHQNQSDSGVDSLMLTRTTSFLDSVIDESKLSEEDILNTGFLETSVSLMDSPFNKSNKSAELVYDENENFTMEENELKSNGIQFRSIETQNGHLKGGHPNVLLSFEELHQTSKMHSNSNNNNDVFKDSRSEDQPRSPANKVEGHYPVRPYRLPPHYAHVGVLNSKEQVSTLAPHKNEFVATKNSLMHPKLYDHCPKFSVTEPLSPVSEDGSPSAIKPTETPLCSLTSGRTGDGYPNKKFNILDLAGRDADPHHPVSEGLSDIREHMYHNLSIIEEVDSVVSNSPGNTNSSSSKDSISSIPHSEKLITNTKVQNIGNINHKAYLKICDTFPTLCNNSPITKSSSVQSTEPFNTPLTPSHKNASKVIDPIDRYSKSANHDSVIQPLLIVPCAPSSVYSSSPMCHTPTRSRIPIMRNQSSSKMSSSCQSAFQTSSIPSSPVISSLHYQASSRTPCRKESVFQTLSTVAYTPTSATLSASKTKLSNSSIKRNAVRKELFEVAGHNKNVAPKEIPNVYSSGILKQSASGSVSKKKQWQQISDESTLTLVDFTVTRLDDASVVGGADSRQPIRTLHKPPPIQPSQSKDEKMSLSLMSFIMHERSAMEAFE